MIAGQECGDIRPWDQSVVFILYSKISTNLIRHSHRSVAVVIQILIPFKYIDLGLNASAFHFNKFSVAFFRKNGTALFLHHGSWFGSISDEEVKEFTEKLENENTKKKTLYDIKVFKEYLDACDEKREIEDITPVELQEIIKKFVLAVRKKNGEEYEPS